MVEVGDYELPLGSAIPEACDWVALILKKQYLQSIAAIRLVYDLVSRDLSVIVATLQRVMRPPALRLGSLIVHAGW